MKTRHKIILFALIWTFYSVFCSCSRETVNAGTVLGDGIVAAMIWLIAMVVTGQLEDNK